MVEEHHLDMRMLHLVWLICKQMWNECGEREVKKVPKTAMLRGYGGAQNVAAIVIRTMD